jgi:glycosyltransferase involved in cell wall biosynthesis
VSPETLNPPLTVAVPTYNGATHLAETLRSILSQDCPPFDLLVCDDRSDDQTLAMVRELAGDRARITINDERLGLAGNWNRCMALSRTPWVSIFHQDDAMLPGHLSWVIQKLGTLGAEDPPVGLIAGPVNVIDNHARPVPESVVSPGGLPSSTLPHSTSFLEVSPGNALDRRIWWSNPLRCSAVILNREAHQRAGGFDPSYRYVVDWEFWLRITRRWTLLWKRFEPTVLVRWHSESETHRFKAGIDDLRETERLLEQVERVHGGDPHTSRLRRSSHDALARAYLNRAHDTLRCGQLDLSRTCLRRAWEVSPRKVLATLATDPRFGAQAGTLAVAPGLAGRWFSRNPTSPSQS